MRLVGAAEGGGLLLQASHDEIMVICRFVNRFYADDLDDCPEGDDQFNFLLTKAVTWLPGVVSLTKPSDTPLPVVASRPGTVLPFRQRAAGGMR